MEYHVNFAVIWRNMPELWYGLGLDLFLAIVSLGIGTVIGLVAAFASVAKNRLVSRTALGYVTLVRNLPILVIVLFVFFALPQASVSLRLDKQTSFIVSLSVYAGAYLTEVFRGGLLAVPKGVVEAGMAIGLRPLQIKRYIVFPIMMRNALPSLGNNFISLFKDTSIASVIAVPELTYYATKINTETFRVVEAWSTAAVLYIATCYIIAFVLRLLERRYSKM